MERLDKLLASQGTWSRKDVKAIISKGRVTVNGSVEKKADRKISEGDSVTIDGELLNIQKHLYLMLNKPQGYVSATHDSTDKTVLDLVPADLKRKNLFPAGRLDKDSTGLIIITDDGDFAHEILSPKKHIPKTYLVCTDIPMSDEMSERFKSGIELNDGICRPANLEIISRYSGIVTLHEGRYHQVKRMFGCCGAKVLSLKRISMGRLSLDPNLPEGACRLLRTEEIELLRSAN